MSRPTLLCRPIQPDDHTAIKHWFGPGTQVNKPDHYWPRYQNMQENGERVVLMAEVAGDVVGYGTLKFASEYPPFQKLSIPEINDLNVVASCRGQGIATGLIHQFEQIARAHEFTEIGIGVGLFADYGAAQRLYVKLDFVPDGRGATYNNRPIQPDASYPVDDDLCLWFTKKLDTA